MSNEQAKQERIVECEERVTSAKEVIAVLTTQLSKLVVDGQVMDVDEYRDYNHRRNIETHKLIVAQAELATAQAMPDETDTISAEDFLKREMAGSDVNYRVCRDELGDNLASLELNLGLRFEDVSITIKKDGKSEVESKPFLSIDTNYTERFIVLLQLAATIAQKWQAHCEQEKLHEQAIVEIGFKFGNFIHQYSAPNKIRVIKLYRAITNLGLKESMNALYPIHTCENINND